MSHSEDEIFDLRVPQPTLHTGVIPKYIEKDSASPASITTALRHMLHAPDVQTKAPTLWNCAEDAFTAFLTATGLADRSLRIATWKPASLKLGAHHTIQEISRDHNEWQSEDFADCDFILLQNPALWDGYYLPEEIFVLALNRIAELCPRTPLLIDQRNLVFTWEEVTPADASQIKIQNPYAVLGSTHPALAPQLKNEVAWTTSNLPGMDQTSHNLSPQALQEALFMVTSFRTKQGPFAAEFQKVMLVVKESLKRISVEMQRLAKPMNFKITHWPAGGLYLRLICPSEVAAKAIANEFAQHGIQLIAGTPYGDPASLMLCYSMHLSQCDRLLRRLGELNAAQPSTF